MHRSLQLICAVAIATASVHPAIAGTPQSRKLTAAQIATVPKPSARARPCPVAMTVERSRIQLSGAEQLIYYDQVVQPAESFTSGSVLEIPNQCAGVYLLSIGYMRDTTGLCVDPHVPQGTTDDVRVQFYKSNVATPDRLDLLGSWYGAWSGADSDIRTNANYLLVVELAAGDRITTWSMADAQSEPRCMVGVTWSAAKLR